MEEPGHWVVAALVRRDGHLLLVEEREAADSVSTWMLPGGKVEPAETPEDALHRELLEETGLRIVGEPAIAFVVEIIGPDGQYVATTFDCVAEGGVHPDDPDGLVLDAAWVPDHEALRRLGCVAWYDCVPLERFLSGDAPAGSTYRFDRR